MEEIADMKFKKQVLIFIFFAGFISTNLWAQNPVVVQIDADSIQIGDPVAMEFIVNTSGGVSIEKISFINYDSIESLVKMQTVTGSEEVFYADFELLNAGNWKLPDGKNMIFEKPSLNWSSQSGDGSLQRNQLSFTIWNEGIYLLPPVQVIFNKGGRTYTQNTNKIPLVVTSPVSKAQQTQDSIALSDIKPIIEEPVKFQDYIPYIIGVILLIHLICLIYFLINNRQKVELLPIPIMQINSHNLAANKLGILKKAELWQQGQIKEYLTKLTFIIREYLENRFDIPALESTSAQILQQMRAVSLAENLQLQLRELFQTADLVKFAKAEPPSQFLENSFEKATNLVRTTQSEANKIWVELSKIGALKNSEESLQLVEQTFRVTENLEELTNPKKLIYADFGERFAARLLDFLFFSLLIFVAFGLRIYINGYTSFSTDLIVKNIDWIFLAIYVSISWLYFALPEYLKGATLGKMILDIQVTNMKGERISLIQTTLRWFGKMLSEALLFFANFWFYFDKEKIQTLYDRFSKTIVIKK